MCLKVQSSSDWLVTLLNIRDLLLVTFNKLFQINVEHITYYYDIDYE